MIYAQRIGECRLCRGPLGDPALSLGDQPISNRLAKVIHAAAMPAYPLDVVLCAECGLPQLAHDLDASEHFHDDYAYISGASSTWVEHCRRYAQSLTSVHGVNAGDLVIEAGSNDGTLLRAFAARGIRVLGVEPSGNVAEIARRAGIDTMTAFFNTETAGRIQSECGNPKAFIGNNVLAHVPDTHEFLSAARDLIAEDGFLCFEFPHFTRILQHRYFDTIYHEHYVYLGVGPLFRWAQRNGMEIFDVEPQPTHGGSLRVFLRRRAAPSGAMPAHVQAIIDQEASLWGPEPWRALGRGLNFWRQDFRELVEGFHKGGRKIAGYAAASKATVICNFLGLSADDIAYCCDASPLKQGRVIPGTGIPILQPEALRRIPPDVIVIFAWNIFDEIADVVAGLIDKPVTIIRPLPEIELVTLTPRAPT